MTTYLITGANRGIGLEFARQLARRDGVTLIGTARDPAKAGELSRLVHEVVPLDVADERSIADLGQRLNGRPIDVLINNAGISGEAKRLADVTMAELVRVFTVNAFAPVLVSRALMDNLRAGKRRVVFNITSQLGSIANNDGGSTYSYRASKTALNQLAVCMANELRPEGFTCVAVHPGWVQTDMGGKNATLTPEQSVTGMLRLLDGLTPAQSGKFFNYDGGALPW